MFYAETLWGLLSRLQRMRLHVKKSGTSIVLVKNGLHARRPQKTPVIPYLSVIYHNDVLHIVKAKQSAKTSNDIQRDHWFTELTYVTAVWGCCFKVIKDNRDSEWNKH